MSYDDRRRQIMQQISHSLRWRRRTHKITLSAIEAQSIACLLSVELVMALTLMVFAT
jgi:hypothetical protein